MMRTLGVSTILFFVVSRCTEAAAAADQPLVRRRPSDNEDKRHSLPSPLSSANTKRGYPFRHLQQQQASPRPCNQDLDSAMITTEDVQAVFDFVVKRVVRLDDGLEQPEDYLMDALQLNYNLRAAKVCLRCSDVGFQDLSTPALLNQDPNGFPAYCNMNEYGWNAWHSALVFYPVEGGTDTIISGELRSVIVGHDTTIDVNHGPSDLWPQEGIASIIDSSTILDKEKLSILQSFIAALGAATAGAVALLPDYIGYGASQDYDRVFLQPLPYLQAATVTYSAAQRFVSQISNECTQLADAATLTGYGEGGYFATVAALALEQNSIDILSVRAGGTPFDLDTQLLYAFGELTETGAEIAESSQLFLAYFGYSFSNSFPFMANTEVEQHALWYEWMNENDPTQNILDWFNAPSTLSSAEILTRIPVPQKQIFNTVLTALYVEAIFEGYSSACRDGTFVTESTAYLCEAILGASLWDVLASATFPVSICHSPQDTVIGFENLPDPTSMPPNVKFYSSEIGVLNPRGDHENAMFFCALDPLLDIADNPGGITSPLYRKPLDDAPGQCAPVNNIPPDQPTCSRLYEPCNRSGTACCAGFLCQDRTINGSGISICTPVSEKNRERVKLAGETGIGGADHRGGL